MRRSPTLDEINQRVELLSRTVNQSLVYHLDLVRREAERRNEPVSSVVPYCLQDNLPYVLYLLQRAAALPDTLPLAVELILVVDRLMTKIGPTTRQPDCLKAGGKEVLPWEFVVQGVAVAVGVPGPQNALPAARVWEAAARAFRQRGDFNRVAWCLDFAKGRVDAAAGSEAALDLQAELRQELGATRAMQHRFEDAAEQGLWLIDYATQLGDVQTMALGYGLLAYIDLQQQQAQACFEHAQQLLIMGCRLGSLDHQGRALHYMAEACRFSGSLTRATYYFSQAADIVNALDNQVWHAHLRHSQGGLEVERADFESAVTNIEFARAFFLEKEDRRNIAYTTESLGIAYYRAGQFAAAEPLLSEAVQALISLKIPFEAGNAGYTLGKLHKQAGRIEQARQALEDAHRIILPLDGPHIDRLRGNIEDELGSLMH